MSKKSSKDPFASIPISSEVSEKDSSDLAEKEIAPLEIEPADVQPPDSEPPKQPPLFPRRRRRRKRSSNWYNWLAVILILGFGVYLLAGYLLVPYLFRSYLPGKLSVMIERPVTVGTAEFNPFTFSLILHNGIIGPRLTDPSDTVDPLFSFSRLEMDFETMSLLKRGVVCKKVSIDQLFLHVVRFPDTTYNITQLLPAALTDLNIFAATDKQGKAARFPFLFSLNNISITGGRLHFYDIPSEKTHVVEDIVVSLPTLSNFPYTTKEYISPEFSAKVNGSPMEIVGQTEVLADGIETRLQMRLDAVDLPAYFAYLPKKPDMDIAKGRADLKLDLLFSTVKPLEERLQVEGEARIVDLRLQDVSGKNLAGIPEIKVVGVFSPLARKYHLKELYLKQPECNLERSADGRLSFLGAILPHPLSDQAGLSLEPIAPAGLLIDRLSVEEGRLSFVDRFVQGGFADTWSDIDLVVKEFSSTALSGRGKPASFTIQAQKRSGDGLEISRLTGQGSISAFPVKIACSLTIDDLPLVHMQPYITSGAFSARDSVQIKKGRANIKGTFVLDSGDKAGQSNVNIEKAAVDLRDLVLAETDREWLQVSSLVLKQASVSLHSKIVDFGKVKVQKGLVSLRYAGQGQVLLKEQLPVAKKTTDQRQSEQNLGKNGWTFNLRTLNMDRFVITAEDRTTTAHLPVEKGVPRLPSPPLKVFLDDVFMQFSGSPDQQRKKAPANQVAGSALVNRQGRLNFVGTMKLFPFVAELNCNIQDLELTGIRPFISNWFNREVTEGRLNAKGIATFPNFSFNGLVGVDNFIAKSHAPVADTIGQESIRWHQADAQGLEFSLDPFSLQIEKIKIKQPFLGLSLLQNGQSSLTDLFGVSPAAIKEKKKSFLFEIKEIVLVDGDFLIADQSVSPPYFSKVADIAGSISNLRNLQGSRASYSLDGLIENIAPINMNGVIGLFDEELFVESKVKINGLDIPPLSPYLEPHLGWEITHGKLVVETDYKQNNRHIDADNHLKVRDLKLGKEIQNDTNLPLTVALLMDPDGVIAMDLPISGETGDPAFSFRGSIIKMVRNLMIKSAISPFSLLNVLIQQEQVSSKESRFKEHLFFQFGKPEPTKEVQEELALFAQVLDKRPWLTLKIKGYADAKGDRDALLSERKKQSAYKKVIEEIRMSKEISGTYGKEEISSPFLGTRESQRQSPDQIQQPEIRVGDAELLQLAGERSLKVWQFFVNELAVDSDRLAVNKESKLVSTGSLGRSGNRVDFILGSKWKGQ